MPVLVFIAAASTAGCANQQDQPPSPEPEVPETPETPDEVPGAEVHFTIFRLDYTTMEPKGYYELTQAYDLMPGWPQWFSAWGQLAFRFEPQPTGATEVFARQTGELVLRATSLYHFNVVEGEFEHPSTPLQTDHAPQALPEEPAATMFLGSGESGEAAWLAVKDTDVMARMADLSEPYEVVVWEHFYATGVDDPATAEWFVIAYSTLRDDRCWEGAADAACEFFACGDMACRKDTQFCRQKTATNGAESYGCMELPGSCQSSCDCLPGHHEEETMFCIVPAISCDANAGGHLHQHLDCSS